MSSLKYRSKCEKWRTAFSNNNSTWLFSVFVHAQLCYDPSQLAQAADVSILLSILLLICFGAPEIIVPLTHFSCRTGGFTFDSRRLWHTEELVFNWLWLSGNDHMTFPAIFHLWHFANTHLFYRGFSHVLMISWVCLISSTSPPGSSEGALVFHTLLLSSVLVSVK